MPEKKDLKILLSAEADKTKTLPELRSTLRAVNEEMNKLRTSGQAGNDVYKQFQQRAGQLSNEIKGLNREMKGWSASSHLTGAGMLNLYKNITVVSAGVIVLARNLEQTLTKGAEYGVLYDSFVKLEGGIDQANKKLALLRQSSAGNLDNKSLIEYSNKLKLLNFTSTETAQFLDIVERKSDQVGVSFQTGQAAIEQFILSGRGKGLRELGMNIADVEKEMIKLSGATKDQIEKMNAETQQRIRTQAILNLYGNTIDQINTKQKDNADRLKSVQTALENVKMEFGRTVAEGIMKFADALGLSDQKMTDVITTVGGIGQALGGLLPVVASLKIAFPALASTITASLGAVLPFLAALAGQVTFVLQSIENVKRIGTFIGDVFSGENIIESGKKLGGMDDFEAEVDDTDRAFMDFQRKKKNEQLKEKEDQKKQQASLMNDIEDQIKGMEKKGKVGTGHKKEEKIELDRVQEIEKELAKLTTERLNAETKGYKGLITQIREEISLLEAKLRMMKEGPESKQFTEFGPRRLTEGPMPEITRIPETTEHETSIESLTLKYGMLNEMLLETTELIGSIFATPPEQKGDALKRLLKTAALQMLSYLEVQLLGAQASAILQSVFTGGLSLFASQPQVIAGAAMLATLRGFIGALATGTDNWRGGNALVGEKGPEIINLPKGSEVVPNNRINDYILANALMQGKSPTVNNYFAVEGDALNIYKIGKTEYDRYRRALRL